MTHQTPFSPKDMERLVRAALDADGRDVDVPRLQSAIQERMKSLGIDRGRDAILPAPSSRRQFFRASLAAAACVTVAGGIGAYLMLSPTPANAHSLVESAERVLALSPDRCYQIEMQAPKGWPFPPFDESTLIWTRGDRYRIIMQAKGKPLVWGQDEQGRVWIAVSPELGLLFEHRELPAELKSALAYLCLDIRQLAGVILQDCDLQIRPQTSPRTKKDVATVRATVKRGRKSFQFETADLDIDMSSKIIRRLELRLVNREANGSVSFTFVDDTTQLDDSYHLKSHLAEGATVLGRSRRAERMKAFMKLVSSRSAKPRATPQSP